MVVAIVNDDVVLVGVVGPEEGCPVFLLLCFDLVDVANLFT